MTDPARPSRSRRTLLLAAGGLVLALALIWFVRRPPPRENGATPPPVGVETAQKQDVPESISVIGTVQPIVAATVRAQLAGTIFSIDVHEGQMVGKGQRLARIDPRPYRIAIEQSRAALARDQAQLDNARLDLGRYQRLLAENSIARQQVDSQSATVRQLAGTVAADRAAVDAARLNLRYTDLLAPVAGRVGLRKADIGDYVTPSSSDGVFVVTVDTPIDVSFAVPQGEVARLAGRKDLPVRAFAQSSGQGAGAALAAGTLLAIDNQADATTGTVTAKARFANRDHRLFPNQFVNVVVTTGTLPGAVTVPVSAVRHGASGDFLFVMGADRKVHARKVRLGPTLGSRVALLSGVRAGEKVIGTGADNLDDGMLVAPQNAPDALRR